MAVPRFLKKAKEIQEAHERRHEEPAPSEGHDESNWLVSYADMMTLLCAFFIMLFSMAKINPPEYEAARKEISEHFGGKYDQPPAEALARFVSQTLQEAGIERDVIVQSDPLGVTVVFHSTVIFDTMSAFIRQPAKILLARLIETIHSKEGELQKKFKIVVEGHTDARPILSGNYPSNWELSSARATRVGRLFIDRGFLPTQIIAIGYGDSRPDTPHRTPSGAWDEAALVKNRRVVIRIMDPVVDTIPWETAKAAH